MRPMRSGAFLRIWAGLIAILMLALNLVPILSLVKLPEKARANASTTWTKYGSNPVINNVAASYPHVIKDGSTYKMWLSRYSGGGGYNSYTTSADGTTWNALQNIKDESSNDFQATEPSIIKDGDTYKMWFSSGGNIGYRTSVDGINWSIGQSTSWSVNRAWDDLSRYEPKVIKDGATYKIWYQSHDGYRRDTWISYATSTNGTTWTNDTFAAGIDYVNPNDDSVTTDTNIVLTLGADGSWDDNYLYSFSVLKNSEGAFELWYSAHGGDNVSKIGYATSADGTTWSKSESNPVVSQGGAGEWDVGGVLYPTVIEDGTTYKMWFQDDSWTGKIGYATAPVADVTAPTITNVTSDTANGSYNAGDTIDIDVTFSEAVTSTGDVTVTLETGDTDRTCTFTVSNSSSGTCTYTVIVGDTSSDLTVSSISGTVTDQSSNPMTNFVPTTNLAANKALVIDTANPTSTPTLDSYYANGSWNGSISGTASDAEGSGVDSVDITIQRGSDSKYWDGDSWETSATWLSATWTTSWSYAFASTNFSENVLYTVQSRVTDNAGNVQTSYGSDSFTAKYLWTKSGSNPVVNDALAKFPRIIKVGSTYKMWVEAGTGDIRYAESNDGTTWPVFASFTLATGDANVHEPSIIYDSTALLYKMWYNSAGGTKYRESADGTTWGDEQSVSFSSTEAWDGDRITPYVFKDGSTYRMYYNANEGNGDYYIAYAYSSNGTSWTEPQDLGQVTSDAINTNNNLVLKQGDSETWEGYQNDEAMYSIFVLKNSSDTYEMWYSANQNGYDASPYFKIGYATSTNATDFTTSTKYSGNPVLKGETSGWDSVGVFYPNVIETNGSYQMWYTAADWVTYKVGYATASYGSDTTAPTITNVTSDTINGYYNAGDTIDIDVTFSEAVTSTGDVTVTLETGDTDRTCTFTVSNSSSGTCTYTVIIGDTSSDLTVSSISGTIADQSSNPMINFVPTTNLAANKALIIDTTSPSVSFTDDVAAGPVESDTITITVSDTNADTSTYEYGYSDDSTCDGTDTYGNSFTTGTPFTISTSTNNSKYICAKATDQAGNISYQASANDLNVSNNAPTITNVTSDKANGYYNAGDTVDVDVTFSEAVTSTGDVTVTLETGDTDRTCTFTVSNFTSGTCTYTVIAGDISSDLNVSLISGTINDQTSNPMVNFVPTTNLADNKSIVIDTANPTSTPTMNSYYNASTWGNAIIGTASDSTSGVASVDITIQRNTPDAKYWDGDSWETSATWLSAIYVSGAWTYVFSSVADGTTYTVQSRGTDNSSNAQTSYGSDSFAYDTTAPSSTPTMNNFYTSGNWPGQITGTATDATSGVALVQVKVQRSSDSYYWTGSAWQSTDPGWQAVSSGTTDWTYTLTTGNLTNGVAYTVTSRATDNAANIESTGSDTFVFNNMNWTQYRLNPIPGSSNMTFPSIIKDGSTYKVWYAVGWSIYYAYSTNGITWQAGNPNGSGTNQAIFSGTAGQWDSVGVFEPWVIKDGSTYKMWYAGSNVGVSDLKIGYATSSDGITWTKSGSNPIISPGPGEFWNNRSVRKPVVIKDGSTYKMWYNGTQGNNVDYNIGYATSTDGIIWSEPEFNPVLTHSSNGVDWDFSNVWGFSVLKRGTGYEMYFSANDASDVHKIGYAYSSNGTTWTKYTTNPVISPGAGGTWNDEDIWGTMIFLDESTYKLWYTGYDGTNLRLGYATMDAVADSTPPVSSPQIIFAYYGSELWTDNSSILGSATDSWGIEKVELKIQRDSDSDYWDGDSWENSEQWINASDYSGNGYLIWNYFLNDVNFDDTVRYTITSKATDGSGSVGGNVESSLNADSFTWDGTDATATLTQLGDAAPATYYNTNLFSTASGTASDATSGVNSVYLSIKRSSDNKYWSNTSGEWSESWLWDNAANTTSWTYTDIQAAMLSSIRAAGDGITYSIYSLAVDTALNNADGGTYSTTSFIYDNTAPTAGSVLDSAGADTDYTGSASQLIANWSGFSDALAGLQKYQYSIGTTAGATNVVGWTDNALAITVTKTGLALSNNQVYYVNVRALDNAQNTSAVVSTDGITVDTAAPSSDPQLARTYYSSSNWPGQIVVNLSDNASGVNIAGIAINRNSDGAGWEDGAWNLGLTSYTDTVNPGASLTLEFSASNLTSGESYTVDTYARDNVLNIQSPHTQEIFTYDTSGPSAVSVNDGISADIDSTGSLSTLSANWTASTDSESGINHYVYAIGTTAGGTDVVNWSDVGTATTVTRDGLNLAVNGAYYFSVRAVNGADSYSVAANSDGLTIADQTPPAVNITGNPGAQTNDTTPTFSGTATDSATNITSIEYLVDAGSWTAISGPSDGAYNELSEEYTITLAALAEGTHTFYVRATDNQANTTTAYAAYAFIVDLSGPAAPIITSQSAGGTVRDSTPTITGTAEAGAIITLTLNNMLYATTADAAGNWSYTIPESHVLPDGSHILLARAMDEAGNDSTNASISFVVDTSVTQTSSPDSPPNEATEASGSADDTSDASIPTASTTPDVSASPTTDTTTATTEKQTTNKIAYWWWMILILVLTIGLGIFQRKIRQ